MQAEAAAVSGALVTVLGLTEYIKALLEGDRELRQVWVVGEVSSAKEHPSGTFFTLSEADGSASLRCVVWKGQRDRLVQQPVVGEQVLVLGSLRLYPKRGEYQLTVVQVLPAGEGLQAIRYRQLRDRLESEGLFDVARKRSLPAYPQTIAVVTSPQAAAWGDMQRTLFQRYPAVRVLLSPATVQGELAPPSIAHALARVALDGRAEVAILGRGGGATEDLACFNDERVVRAIAACRIPVVTGIGHQRDESLADLVADCSAHTPTAAAELVVPECDRLQVEHRQRQMALVSVVERKLQREQERLRLLRERLQALPAESRRLLTADRHHHLLREKLAALDPRAVLQRGYALLRDPETGTAARTASELELGQELIAELGSGRVRLGVREIL